MKLLEILAFALAVASTSTDAFCFQTVGGCFANAKCNAIFEEMKEKCWNLVSFDFNSFDSLFIQCTPKCQQVLRSILKQHPKIISCACQDSDCMVVKKRVLACLGGQLSHRKKLNIKRHTSCTKRFGRCNRNLGCREVFEQVPRQCNTMLNNYNCTKGCEKALTNFFDHPHAKRIPNCVCDGTQYFEGTCLMIRHRIETMCSSNTFQKYLKTKKIVIRSGLSEPYSRLKRDHGPSSDD